MFPLNNISIGNVTVNKNGKEEKVKLKCEGCGTKYVSKHNCNPKSESYYQTQIKKKKIEFIEE